ncbi:MAG: ADP-glyceromanno-heptose 6-epimerase [Desulfonauticus sp.]|nr:ADP-glyceromanno-heptose 6-epimerase [Desulfonauticus sp.]
MYIVTGGAGFIGSAFVWHLNQQGIDDILVVDNLGLSSKWKNLVSLKYKDYVHKSVFLALLAKNKLAKVKAIIHMGACSSTTEQDADYLMENNFHYSQKLAQYALNHDVRFIYASSAATYGDGSLGFDDNENELERLRPLNMYGYSKHLFDLWLKRENKLSQVVGLKFFNVFGPNEYHKDDMKSVVCKAYFQIKQTGRLKLFKSYHPDYAHGEQKRDFVYIKDCLKVMSWFLENPEVNGIFNVGTGQARSWNDLARAVFTAMGKPVNIEYIEMPETLKNKYQYFTQAKMQKLFNAGYPHKFLSLEEAVKDYVQNYLSQQNAYLENG